jgi:hypothetical protein
VINVCLRQTFWGSRGARAHAARCEEAPGHRDVSARTSTRETTGADARTNEDRGGGARAECRPQTSSKCLSRGRRPMFTAPPGPINRMYTTLRPYFMNLNPGQDTQTRRHTRRHTPAQDQPPTNQPHTQPTSPHTHSHTHAHSARARRPGRIRACASSTDRP